jgi:hypothetical protein
MKKKVIEKKFGKISAEERRRALEGEIIDHHLTEYECDILGYSTNFIQKFNKYATPRMLSELYAWRKDKEMQTFFFSIKIPDLYLPRVSDCRLVKDYDAYIEELKARGELEA